MRGILKVLFTLIGVSASHATVIARVRDTLDLAVLAGQHVIYSYPGLTPPASLLDLARQGKVGGVILFKENVGNGTASAISSLQSAHASSPAASFGPLLITTDQEGGEVRRISTGGPFLSAKKMGSAADPVAAGTQGAKEAAAALLPLGFNTNLAPVLDIYRTPGDFEDQFERSFGNTSDAVRTAATPFISTQQSQGVAATAKHFPGLGAASKAQNTDLGPVTLNLTIKEIRTKDEVPYVDAISAGVKLVMTSWAVYPALDAEYPSGLSKKWILEELRGRLKFRGVTITDALEAGALNSFGADPGKRAVLAAQAGMDLLLASARDASQGESATNALAAALGNGTLTRENFDAATARIIALRRCFPKPMRT